MVNKCACNILWLSPERNLDMVPVEFDYNGHDWRIFALLEIDFVFF